MKTRDQTMDEAMTTLMDATIIPVSKQPMERRSTFFDPELLYVECGVCGRPVVWDQGEATEFVAWLGVNAWAVDSTCLIVTHGCAQCAPFESAYRVQMLRAGESLDDAMAQC